MGSTLGAARPPAVILSSSTGGFPEHGVLGAIRTLGRWGVPVILASPTTRGVAAGSRYVTEHLPWSPTSATASVLGDLVRRRGRVVAIPADDASVLALDAVGGHLDEQVVFPRLPEGLAARLIDKVALAALAVEAGLDVPDQTQARTGADVDAFAAVTGFPLIVKTPLALRPLGLPSVSVARDRSSLLDALARADGAPILLQAFVAGSPRSANWMFDGVFDLRGGCRFWGTGRKLAQHPPYTGMATHGRTERNDDVAGPVVGFLEGLGFVGPVDVDVRWDDATRRYVLLDVNPRMGGTFRLFVASDGTDVVRATYLDLIGSPIPEATVLDGRVWMLGTHVAASSIAYRRDGWLTIGASLRSVRGVDEGALAAWDDLRPAVRAAGRVAARAVDRLRGRSGAVSDPGEDT